MLDSNSQASQIDRDLFSGDFTGLAHGNHVATVVSFEPSGNSNVQRFPGLFTSTIIGAGLGDLDTDGDFSPQADFGDAPSSYPVTRSEDGVVHIATGPTLGATRDKEVDGVHSAAAAAAADADADADADGSDEDGVVDTGADLVVGQAGASVTVNVQNAPGGAKLDAWMDFNQDGDWNDSGEHILVNAAVINGDNVLAFDVPATASVGTTYARLRLSTGGGLGVTGLAADGEVEDNQVEITAVENLVFNFASGDNVIVLSDNGVPNDGISRITSTVPSEVLEFTNPSGKLTINAGDGADLVTLSPLEAGSFSIVVNGQSGDDTIDASAVTVAIKINGSGGNDTLTGGSANDTFNGGSGEDLLVGNSGNDTLQGMRGADVLNGGAGNDWLDRGTQNDKLSGWTGDDELYGRSENDILVGGEGNDSLYGASGDDILQGDDGKADTSHVRDDDRLDGGDGSDTVRGGGGSDTKFDGASEIDESFAYWAEWVDAV